MTVASVAVKSTTDAGLSAKPGATAPLKLSVASRNWNPPRTM